MKLKTGVKKTLKWVFPRSMKIALKKRYYLGELKKPSLEEEPDLEIVNYLVGKGDWVVDGGANYGLYTTVLSDKVGPGGRVLSFEPIPDTYEVLAHGIKKMRMANVTAHQIALSDKASMMTMEVPNYDDGTENFYQARLVQGRPEQGLASYEIRTQTLDEIITGLDGRISFIKCDVEGHELQVIRGALNTIRELHPAWLIELSTDPDDPGSEAAELIDLMLTAGYRVYWFDQKRLRERCSGDKSVNYFFLASEHLEVLAEAGFEPA